MKQESQNYRILLELARRRKSIRRFKPNAKIPLTRVLEAIKVALEAPSGRNCQPWQFIIIDDKDTKHKIRTACEEAEKKFHKKIKGEFKKWLKERNITWRKPFLEEATYLIVVYTDKRCPYTVQSTWLAIGYLLLALEENGLASLTYTPSNPEKISYILNVPQQYKLEAIIPVGYPKGEKKKEPREPLHSKVHINKWEIRMKIESINNKF